MMTCRRASLLVAAWLCCENARGLVSRPPVGVTRQQKGSRSSWSVAQVAPSGIDALPLVEQQTVFVGIYAMLGASTIGAVRVTDALQRFAWFRAYKKTWFLLGAVYALAGYAHFAVSDAFTAIYPPPGTWGLWALPGSPEFHVAWTGVAELLGGSGLVLGGLAAALAPGSPVARLAPLSAAALFALTLAVTPANIYMYTHGAIMVGAGPDGPLPVEFHYVRFVAQVVLLTILAAIAASGRNAPPDDYNQWRL